MGSYDKVNKVKEECKKIIEQKDKEILSLKDENSKLKNDNAELRQKLYDVGEGKGEIHHLKSIINGKERDNQTLQNKINKLEGNEKLSNFSKERKNLIKNIRNLSFPNNSIFEHLAYKFKDGTENVINIAYKIKINSAVDMDFYTYLFRDDIVGLLEKILHVLTNKTYSSASNYLITLINKESTLDKQYYQTIPLLADKETLQNILWLINLQSKGYHGSREKERRVFIDKESGEKRKFYDFLNVDKEKQLNAIFTLLEFIYYFFTNKDAETNLIAVSSYWFKTID